MFEFCYHFSWIQENKELKKTIESTVERAYMHGRKVIAVKVQWICTHEYSSSIKHSLEKQYCYFGFEWFLPLVI